MITCRRAIHGVWRSVQSTDLRLSFSVLQVPGLMHALTAVRLLTLKETMVKTYYILMSFTLSRLRLGHETLAFRCAYTTNAQGNQEEEMKVV